MAQDYYDLIGVARDASDADIKKAFRRRARELHPDVSDDPDAEARFKEIAAAYSVLSDPETRARYDRFGAEGLRGAPGPDFADFGSFQDLFDAVFGGEFFGRRGAAGAGEDALVQARIDLVESALGTRREVEAELLAVCATCGGDGTGEGSELTTCETCAGSGRAVRVTRSIFGDALRTTVTCPTCAGRGGVPEHRCATCLGKGRATAKQTIEVEIPAGIADGQRIVMRGRGHVGDLGAPAGDLYVHVDVAPDERFVRDGLDIVTRVRVPVTDAMLGTRIEVPTVEGDQTIEIPAGTQPETEIVIKGRGFPAVNRRGRGDQRVLVEVVVPRVESEAARRAVESLADSLDEASYGDGEGFFDRIRHAFR
jgi:molecular chaperone DnaJ